MSDKTVASTELRQIIEGIERLESEKTGINDDIKDTYGEAKSVGFDVKTIRKIIAMRKQETHVRSEAEMLLATYAAALGMQLGFDL